MVSTGIVGAGWLELSCRSTNKIEMQSSCSIDQIYGKVTQVGIRCFIASQNELVAREDID